MIKCYNFCFIAGPQKFAIYFEAMNKGWHVINDNSLHSKQTNRMFINMERRFKLLKVSQWEWSNVCYHCIQSRLEVDQSEITYEKYETLQTFQVQSAASGRFVLWRPHSEVLWHSQLSYLNNVQGLILAVSKANLITIKSSPFKPVINNFEGTSLYLWLLSDSVEILVKWSSYLVNT